MGTIRQKPQKIKHTEVFRHQNIAYATSSMCGWRTYMEDSIVAVYPYCQKENMCLFGIFDGHGGPECAEYASKYFAEVLKNKQNIKIQKYEEALTETYMSIDQMMRTKIGMKQLEKIRKKHAQKNNAQNYNGNSISGTTANICLLTNQFVYVANVGDSRTIGILKVKNGKSKLKIMSKDHIPHVQTEKQRILKAGGSISQQGRINNNLNLSRTLGDFSYKNNPNLKIQQQIISPIPQIQKISRKQLCFILMGCDGIWQNKANQQMAQWLIKTLQGKNATLRSTIQRLFNEQIAQSNDKQNGLDNMSAIILKI